MKKLILLSLLLAFTFGEIKPALPQQKTSTTSRLLSPITNNFKELNRGLKQISKGEFTKQEAKTVYKTAMALITLLAISQFAYRKKSSNQIDPKKLAKSYGADDKMIKLIFNDNSPLHEILSFLRYQDGPITNKLIEYILTLREKEIKNIYLNNQYMEDNTSQRVVSASETEANNAAQLVIDHRVEFSKHLSDYFSYLKGGKDLVLPYTGGDPRTVTYLNLNPKAQFLGLANPLISDSREYLANYLDILSVDYIKNGKNILNKWYEVDQIDFK